MSELTLSQGYVYSNLALDPDLGELVEMFVDEMPERVEKLQDCWDRADLDGLGRVAHQFKGAAGSYGFEELTPFLQRLDHSVRTARPDDEILAALDGVIEMCERVRAGAPA